MNPQYNDKIKRLYSEGFAICELAIMYDVPEYKIKRVLEIEG